MACGALGGGYSVDWNDDRLITALMPPRRFTPMDFGDPEGSRHAEVQMARRSEASWSRWAKAECFTTSRFADHDQPRPS